MSEGPVNLNWGPIMKHINENPFEFFQHDGWSFLGGATGVEVRLPSLLSRNETISVYRVITPKNRDQNQNLKQILKNLWQAQVVTKKATTMILMSVVVTPAGPTLVAAMIATKKVCVGFPVKSDLI